MNITGKDRKDCAPASCFPSAFVVSFQAKSRDATERQYRFSIPFGRSASSSFLTSFSHAPVSLTGRSLPLQLSRGEFACLNKEFPRTEKLFPRTTQ